MERTEARNLTRRRRKILSLNELTYQFMKDVELGVYAYDLVPMREYFGDRKDLTVNELQNYQAWLETRYSQSSIQRKLIVFRKFLDWAVFSELIPAEVYAKIQVSYKIKGIKKHYGYLGRSTNTANVKKLLAHIEEQIVPEHTYWGKIQTLCYARNRAFIMLAYTCGGRLAELISLDRGYFDQFLYSWDGVQEFHIEIVGKGNKKRYLIVWPRAMRMIKQYLDLRGRDTKPGLFIGHGPHSGDERVQPRTIEWAIEQIAKNLDIKVMYPHALRHEFVKTLIQADVPLPVIADSAGHSDIGTTKNVYGGLMAATEVANKLRGVMGE